MIACLGFIIGIIWGLYFKISIALICIPVFILYIVCIKISKYRKILKLFKNVLCIFCISIIIADTYTKLEIKSYEKLYNFNSQISNKAIVISEAKETEYKKIYNVKMTGNMNNKTFILKVNKKANFDINYGDLIYIYGEYEAPSIGRNYKGFDYSKYLKSKKIYGVINANKVYIISENNINCISKIINDIRNNIIYYSNEMIKDKDISALLIGVLIGDTSYIDDEIIEYFRNSSLTHMLAVSGQHVAYIVLAISFALNISKMGKRSGKIISIVVLVLFMLITGLTASVCRAGIMGILLIIAGLFYRKSDIYINLALSMLLMLIANPFSIYDIGLQLSYRWGIRNCIIS